MALVTLDLGRSFGPGSLERLRAAAKVSSGISCLIVTASHTHSAPVIKDQYEDGTPAWERSALSKIEHAIREATEHMAAARIGAGTGTAYIGHNRLRVNADGSVSWFERNRTRIPTAPVDATVSVVRIDRADGLPIAVLTNYACHPVVFGSDNLQYSARLPGRHEQRCRTETRRPDPQLFLAGSSGRHQPVLRRDPD